MPARCPRATATVMLLLAFAAGLGCKSRSHPAAAAKPARIAPDSEPPSVAKLEPWPAGPLVAERVHYRLALYFTPAPTMDPLAAVTACASVTQGLRRVEPGSDPPDEPAYAVRRMARAAFDVPDVDQLTYLGVDLTPEVKAAVQRTEDPLVLTFAAPGGRAVELLGRSAKLMNCLAERTGGLVWDEETRQLFSRNAWQSRRVFEAVPPVVSGHFTIHAYEEAGDIRMVSLGLAKLGLPDLVIQRTTASKGEDLMQLMNLAAQELLRRGALDQAGRLSIDFADNLAAPRERPGLDAALPGKVTLEVARVKPAPGDADNRLMEICFGAADSGEQERQASFINTVFGSQRDDIIGAADDDAELLAASERARAKLPDVHRRYNKGLPAGARLMVKARFESEDGAEWMWIEVRTWKGNELDGILLSRPEVVRNVAEGAHVTVSQDGLFDYIIHDGNGTREGGETNEVLERRASAKRQR